MQDYYFDRLGLYCIRFAATKVIFVQVASGAGAGASVVPMRRGWGVGSGGSGIMKSNDLMGNSLASYFSQLFDKTHNAEHLSGIWPNEKK